MGRPRPRGGAPPVGVAGHKRDEPVYGREVDSNHQVSVECRHMDIDKQRCGERHNNWPETSAHPELGRAVRLLTGYWRWQTSE